MSCKKCVLLLLLGVLLSACGEYYQVQKSPDINERYAYAKKSYNEKRYKRVVTLMNDIVGNFTGTAEGPQSLYLLADSYYHLGQSDDAAATFRNYYTSYPKAPRVEEARYKSGECLYKDAPDPRLDQSRTYAAIKELQGYLDFYPKGKYKEEVESMLFDLQDRLAEKAYLAAELYYNLGLYLGNNYLSCVITAENALKDFPYTKWKEELVYLILKAKYEQAINSVYSRMQERFREVVDQYYAYANEFPEGKYKKEARKIYEEMNRYIERKQKAEAKDSAA